MNTTDNYNRLKMQIYKMSVNMQDINDIRDLLRMYMFVSLKENYTLAENEMIDIIFNSLDKHQFLEEPFIASALSMEINGAVSGELLISKDHVNAFNTVAYFDFKNAMEKYPLLKNEEKFIIPAQSRFIEILKKVLPASEEIPETSKQFLN